MRIVWLAGFIMVGACYYRDPYVSAQYSVGYGYGYGTPSMAYVGPGVQVVTDYDYPVFFSDGYYWRYDSGLWYRSGFYNRGWAVSYDVPYAVRGISRPEGYVRYRGDSGYRPNQNWGRRVPANPGVQAYGGGSTYRASPPVYRSSPPVYRSSPPAYRGNGGGGFRGGPSGPVIRDHR
jgi:hypothetical protein